MSDETITTRPPTRSETLLQEKFSQSIVDQSEQMDKLGRQLITLELAIPGLYATVLKLVAGQDATLALGYAFYLTFGCWFLAVALTLYSLIPKKFMVDRTIIRQGPDSPPGEVLGIEDFFERSAQHKRKYLIGASLLFFAGIISTTFTVF